VKPRTFLLLAVAAALIGASSGEAKFSISFTVKPVQVWAKQPARVIVRTGVVLPRQHGLRLSAVGSWHARYGNAFFEARLRRTGPKTYEATVRFPRGGVWTMVIPNWGGHALRVQPAP
jgi:hypothetical protein